MFDHRKLKAFCCVYEQRSFSKAGEVLSLSQPTISAHVQSLEKETGVRLLDRMGRTVLPTSAGVVLYRHCILAFAELEAAKNEINRLMGEIAGEIVIGSSSIPAVFILPNIVSKFIQAHPKVNLNITVSDSSLITKSVLDCELMLGVVGAVEEHQDLEFSHIVDDELIIVGHKDSKFLKAKALYSPADLFSMPWVMREDGSGTKKTFENALLKAGYNPKALEVILQVSSTETAIKYTLAALGVTVTSRLAVENQLKSGDLIEIKVDGLLIKRQFYYVQNIRRGFFPAVSSFMSFLSGHTAFLRK